ncbi:MAG: ATP-binding protein [Desulfovibrionales bacterium]|nr:ATP-binding protein [Desulfovibrionales bacterium]
MTTVEEFDRWLRQPEDRDIEFKKAEYTFSKDKGLPDYCAAMANEGGGRLILGVNNNRQVVGTRAFEGTGVYCPLLTVHPKNMLESAQI